MKTYSTWKYKDLDVKDIAKLIRGDLKKKYPRYLFSVTIERYSMGRSINVLIRKVDFQVRSPGYDPSDCASETNKIYTDRAEKILQEVEDLVKGYNYDNSDPQTDYFDVGFYSDVLFERVEND